MCYFNMLQIIIITSGFSRLTPRNAKPRNKTANPSVLTPKLLTQLVSEICAQQTRTQKSYPELKITEGRPRKYYYSEKSDSEEVEAVEGSPSKPAEGYRVPGEYSLYPLRLMTRSRR
jgi:hypothetical protein